MRTAFTLSLSLLPFLTTTTADEVPPRPRIEVVFALDTTGSMAGLIASAKASIWRIANEIAAAEPAPELRIGLVAYRDQGDEYVTRVLPLTDDLDAVHRELTGYQADGGGDGPEDVNAALAAAVSQASWSDDASNVLRIVFVVGDAPPHMDYDGPRYPEICRAAVQRGLIVNTIRCGGDASTATAFQDMAHLGEGRFETIDASGGTTVRETPVDARLAELNARLLDTSIAFGDDRARRDAAEEKAIAMEMPAAEAAGRAEYVARKSGFVGRFDLVDAVRAGDVDLAQVSDEVLPEEFRRLSLEGRRAKLEDVARERADLTAEITRLSEERRRLITEAEKDDSQPKDGFDGRVLEIVRKQALDKGIVRDGK